MIDLTCRQLDAAFLTLWIENISKIVNLRTIKLAYNFLGNDGAKVLADYLATNFSVTCIDISFNQIGDEGIKYICDSLRNNQKVCKIHLNGNNISPLGFKYLSDLLKENLVITHLSVAGNNCGPKGAQYLSEALFENFTLTVLDCSNCKILSAGCATLATALSHHHNIRKLYLDNNMIDDAGMNILSRSLSNDHNLETLSLSMNSISVRSFEALACAFSSLDNIQQLHLTGVSIGDKGAFVLAEVICIITQMTDFHIGYNNIGESGMITLMRSLSTLRCLQELLISGNTFTVAVAQELSNAILSNTSLTRLFMEGIRFDEASEDCIAALIATNKCPLLETITGFPLGPALVRQSMIPQFYYLTNANSLIVLNEMRKIQEKPRKKSLKIETRVEDISHDLNLSCTSITTHTTLEPRLRSSSTGSNDPSPKRNIVDVYFHDGAETQPRRRNSHSSTATSSESTEEIMSANHSFSNLLPTSSQTQTTISTNDLMATLKNDLLGFNKQSFDQADLWMLHQYYFSPGATGNETIAVSPSVDKFIDIDEDNPHQSYDFNNLNSVQLVKGASTISPVFDNTSVLFKEDCTTAGNSGSSEYISTPRPPHIKDFTCTGPVNISKSMDRILSLQFATVDDTKLFDLEETYLRPKKRPSNKFMQMRIGFYPRLKQFLDILKHKQDDKQMLTILRQLQFLEKKKTEYNLDFDIEKLILGSDEVEEDLKQ